MCLLVVENECITLLALAAVLEAAGRDVITAEHGQCALGYLKSHPRHFTCLITDFRMAGQITGAHVVEHMRPAYPTIPMILTTALTHSIAVEWCTRHSVHVVPKPYNLHNLVAKAIGLLSG